MELLNKIKQKSKKKYNLQQNTVCLEQPINASPENVTPLVRVMHVTLRRSGWTKSKWTFLKNSGGGNQFIVFGGSKGALCKEAFLKKSRITTKNTYFFKYPFLWKFLLFFLLIFPEIPLLKVMRFFCVPFSA